MTTTEMARTQVEQAIAEQPVLDGVPRGPRLPRALQTVLWATRPLSFMQRARRRHGDVFTIRPYGFPDIVVLADPEHIKEVFTGDRDVFAAGKANAAMSPVLGSHSLLTLDGERHLRQRKLMLPPFHGEAIGRYRERIEEITKAEIARWPIGKPFPIRPRMQDITFEIILRAVIGVSDPRRLERLREVLPKLLDFSVFDMWAVWVFPKLLDSPIARRNPALRMRPEIDRLLYEEIAAHRANPEGHDDILALLLRAREEDGEPLSDENLLDQIITLLLAGHETTTTGLAWAFERLTRNPDVLGRLRQELGDRRGEVSRGSRERDAPRPSRDRRCLAKARRPGNRRRSPPARRDARLPRDLTGTDIQRRVSRSRGVPPRALPRGLPSPIHLHPIRRRDTPLHRRGFCDDGDEDSARHRASTRRVERAR